MPMTQKSLTNVSKATHKDFFERIQGKSCHIHAAFDMLEQRFDTHHVHTQARAYLNGIKLTDIHQKYKCDEAEAIQHAHDQIVKTLLKCGKSLQGDDYMIFGLQRILQGEEWAAPVIPLTGSANLIYEDFHIALNTAVSAHLERFRHRHDNLAPPHNPDSPSSAMTFYGSQDAMRFKPRLTAARTTVPSHRHGHVAMRPWGPRSRSAAELAALKSRTRCDCREIGHWQQECPTRRQ